MFSFRLTPILSTWKGEGPGKAIDLTSLEAAAAAHVVVGRSQEHGIVDNRCSRKQAELSNVPGQPKLRLKQLGPNPAVVKSAAGKTSTTVNCGEVHDLSNGDVLGLLLDIYHFTVTIETVAAPKPMAEPEVPQKAAPKGQAEENLWSSEITSKTHSSQRASKKRARADSDGSVSGGDDDDEYQPPPNKRVQIAPSPSKPSSSKPPCKYGAKCYRKNPQHLEEFDHPHLQEEKEKPAKPPATTTTTTRGKIVEEKDDDDEEGSRKIPPRADKRNSSEPLYQPPLSISSSSSSSLDKNMSTAEMALQFVKDVRSLSPQKNPEKSAVAAPASSSSKPAPSFSAAKIDILDSLVPTSKGKAPITVQGSGSAPSSSTEPAKKPVIRNLFVGEEPAPKPATPKMVIVEDDSQYASADSAHSLAFSSLSTALGGFDKEEASEIVKQAATQFLENHPHKNLKLLMVVDPEEPETYRAMKKCVVNDPRFSVMLGDISKVRTKQDILDCGIIGVEATWRLQAGGTSANRKVHQAAGKILQDEAKALYNVAKVGVAYPVKLPSDCPFTLSEGIHHVINVVGPNFNPNRPDCIEDKAKGSLLLRQAYDELFACFFKLTKLPPPRQEGAPQPKGAVQPVGSSAAGTSAAASAKGGWGNALYAYVDNPEKQGAAVFHFDTETVTIFDKYPKARKHLLIMPRKHIDGIDVLKPGDIPLLEVLKKRAELTIKELTKEDSDLKFRFGYHAVPSMRQLHLHVISQDFDSPNLKTKKHWNSFTTAYFVTHEQLVEHLQQKGKVEFSKPKYEALLDGPLVCHLCEEELKTIPKLKQHLTEHLRQ